MAAKTILINEDKLKELTLIGANVDFDLLRPHIEHAQHRYTRDVVGRTLFDTLLTQKAADTLSVVNATLLNDFIVQSLAAWTFHRGLSFLGMRITGKGIVKKSADNSDATADVDGMRHVVKSDAEHYDDLLIEFLKDNIDDYPEYRDEDNGVKTAKYTNSGFGGFV